MGRIYNPDPEIIPERWLPDPPPDSKIPRRKELNPTPVISIIGIVHEGERVEVQSVARVNVFTELPNAKGTRFIAELIDKDGKAISSARLYRLPSYGGRCGCGNNNSNDLDSNNEDNARPPYSFQGFLPDTGAGEALRIVSEGK